MGTLGHEITESFNQNDRALVLSFQDYSSYQENSLGQHYGGIDLHKTEATAKPMSHVK